MLQKYKRYYDRSRFPIYVLCRKNRKTGEMDFRTSNWEGKDIGPIWSKTEAHIYTDIWSCFTTNYQQADKIRGIKTYEYFMMRLHTKKCRVEVDLSHMNMDQYGYRSCPVIRVTEKPLST